MSVVFYEVKLLVGRVETARIADPPVGFVLDGNSINVDAIVMHPLQECVQPREELVITVKTQFASLVTLIVGVATLCSSVSLIFSGG